MTPARRFMPSWLPQWEELNTALPALVAALEAESFDLAGFCAASQRARTLLDDLGLRGEFAGGGLSGDEPRPCQTAVPCGPASLARELVGGWELTEQQVKATRDRWPHPATRHGMACWMRDAFQALLEDTKPETGGRSSLIPEAHPGAALADFEAARTTAASPPRARRGQRQAKVIEFY
jgi:hypothetical protein